MGMRKANKQPERMVRRRRSLWEKLVTESGRQRLDFSNKHLWCDSPQAQAAAGESTVASDRPIEGSSDEKTITGRLWTGGRTGIGPKEGPDVRWGSGVVAPAGNAAICSQPQSRAGRSPPLFCRVSRWIWGMDRADILKARMRGFFRPWGGFPAGRQRSDSSWNLIKHNSAKTGLKTGSGVFRQFNLI